jgi:hypothetical protein
VRHSLVSAFIYDAVFRGPTIIGDELFVRFKDVDGDGIDEIVVKSAQHPASHVVIKVIISNGHGVRYHIVEAERMGVGFPEEGYYSP